MLSEEGYLRLIESLKLLGSGVEIQESSFPNYVHIPDELAIIFHDALVIAKQEDLVKWFNKEQILGLEEIDEIFENMNSQPEFWTLEGMKTNPIWQDIRISAQKILKEKDISSQELPNLFWLDFFKSKDDL